MVLRLAVCNLCSESTKNTYFFCQSKCSSHFFRRGKIQWSFTTQINENEMMRKIADISCFLLLLVGRTKDKRKRKFWMEVTIVLEFIPWRQDRRPRSWHQRSWRESQRWLCLDMRRGVLIFSHPDPDPAASYLRCRRCRARTSIRSWQRWKLHQQPRSGPKFLVKFKHPEVFT